MKKKLTILIIALFCCTLKISEVLPVGNLEKNEVINTQFVPSFKEEPFIDTEFVPPLKENRRPSVYLFSSITKNKIIIVDFVSEGCCHFTSCTFEFSSKNVIIYNLFTYGINENICIREKKNCILQLTEEELRKLDHLFLYYAAGAEPIFLSNAYEEVTIKRFQGGTLIKTDKFSGTGEADLGSEITFEGLLGRFEKQIRDTQQK